MRRIISEYIRIFANVHVFFCFPFMPLQSGRPPSKHNTVWVGMRTMFVLPISSNKMRNDLITSGKISKDRIDRRVDSILCIYWEMEERWDRERERECVCVCVCVSQCVCVYVCVCRCNRLQKTDINCRVVVAWSHHSTKTFEVCCGMQFGRRLHVPANQISENTVLFRPHQVHRPNASLIMACG